MYLDDRTRGCILERGRLRMLVVPRKVSQSQSPDRGWPSKAKRVPSDSYDSRPDKRPISLLRVHITCCNYRGSLDHRDRRGWHISMRTGHITKVSLLRHPGAITTIFALTSILKPRPEQYSSFNKVGFNILVSLLC